MSYSLPNLFLWASVRILALIAMLYFTMVLALFGGLVVTHWDLWITIKQ